MSAVAKRTNSVPGASDCINYKIAATRAERKAAFRMVYKSYLEAGLSVRNPHRMRVSPYHLESTTQMFVALQEDEMIFTASLVVDGALGLPLESIFPGEVAERRERGMRMAEVTCLADRRKHFRSCFPVFLELSRMIVHYARRQQIDEILVATHPRHARLYRRMLCFQPFGEQRDYPLVRNSPAVPLVLNFEVAEQEQQENYDALFGRVFPVQLLQPQPMTPEQRDYFARFVDDSYKRASEVPAAC